MICLSGFAYVSSLKISSQPIAANCDVSTDKLYPIGHLIGSVLGVIPIVILCSFRLPVFIGKLTDIFTPEGNNIIHWSAIYTFVGNFAAAIGCGAALNGLFHKTNLFPMFCKSHMRTSMDLMISGITRDYV